MSHIEKADLSNYSQLRNTEWLTCIPVVPWESHADIVYPVYLRRPHRTLISFLKMLQRNRFPCWRSAYFSHRRLSVFLALWWILVASSRNSSKNTTASWLFWLFVPSNFFFRHSPTKKCPVTWEPNQKNGCFHPFFNRVVASPPGFWW